MSRNSKKSKSTNKYRQFRISPVIPVIAILEVIVLIGSLTYAWFAMAQEKDMGSGIITVDADSGVDIDIKNATYNDVINLWDYVDDDFAFEPVTSLDGRNVYIPTSGSFNSTNTSDMVFREATVNDINTKYINVDFMMTNTSNESLAVYLNNESRFNVKETSGSTVTSRALRLAFYTNDGHSGKVDSTLLANTNDENAAIAADTADKTQFTVYFKNVNNWSSVNAYTWHTETVDGVNKDEPISAWPGTAMTRVCGDIYSYTFSNPKDGVSSYYYNKIIFNSGNGGSQTVDITPINNGYIYNCSTTKNAAGTTDAGKYPIESSEAYTTRTVYFVKPSTWSGVNAHAWKRTYTSTTECTDSSLTTFPGDSCTAIGAELYSYTFPSEYNMIKLSKPGDHDNNQTKNIVLDDLTYGETTIAEGITRAYSGSGIPTLYFDTSANDGSCRYVESSNNTVYFYNSIGFAKPHVYISTNNQTTTEIAMTSLGGNVYYSTIPNVYRYLYFEDGTGKTDGSKNTTYANVTDGYIYRAVSTQGAGPNMPLLNGSSLSRYGYLLEDFSYDDTAGSGTYAVISPGVSAGFQRAYTPVIDTYSSGKASRVVPAFASSIDTYIRGSGEELFTIEPNHAISLSMVIWLEGTDDSCDAATYATIGDVKKQIEMYLKFSTTILGDEAQTYTYRFYDKTKEVWTCDRITTASGLKVAPVMQLYDVEAHRGYLMHVASTTQYAGQTKVDVWECTAPTTLVTDHDHLVFRRVNPYNEDEVWNYWYAGECVVDAAQSTATINGKTTYYINFTALGDPSPVGYWSTGVGGEWITRNENTSIGGLWGKYNTEELYFVDGTGGTVLDDSNGAMTITYTYHYDASHSATIEYKASGPYYNGQFYYFIIPTKIDASRPEEYDSTAVDSSVGYSFKRYYNCNSKYAMNNLEYNGSMTYDGRHSYDYVDAISGPYSMMLDDLSDETSFPVYFGKALCYVQARNKTDGNDKNIFDPDARLQIEFINSSGVTIRRTNLYSANSEWKYTDFYGYCAVVPNDTAYWLVNRMSTNYYTIYGQLKRDQQGYRWLRWYDTGDFRLIKIYSYTEVPGDYNDLHYENITTPSWPGSVVNSSN